MKQLNGWFKIRTQMRTGQDKQRKEEVEFA